MWRWIIALIATLATTAGLAADDRAIDVSTSRLTIHVFKSGILSAFADNHLVDARIASALLNQTSVNIVAWTSELTVVDPDASEGARAEVQRRMLGPDVLDSERFPEITFKSTVVEPAGNSRWRVTGELILHGRARPLSVTVTERAGHYLGSFALKQCDFGIEPVSIAGGVVKVKDELTIEFDIVSAPRGAPL
jgi:polyisoprenoid-binding protein YceI